MTMTTGAGALLYVAGLVVSEGLRFGRRVDHLRAPDAWKGTSGQSRLLERVVLTGVILGIWVFPSGYIATSSLDRFDYAVPPWTFWAAAAIFMAGLVVRWSAHRTLGRQWSHTLETTDGHQLVTAGIYGRVRHPIYAALTLWAIAQPFLLPNVLAGLGGVVASLLMWCVRVPREEQMMLERFGDEYRQYMARTPRLIPRLGPTPLG
jgi:protein-S-isoprenylcysteine O-methyltransferase Ste14